MKAAKLSKIGFEHIPYNIQQKFPYTQVPKQEVELNIIGRILGNGFDTLGSQFLNQIVICMVPLFQSIWIILKRVRLSSQLF